MIFSYTFFCVIYLLFNWFKLDPPRASQTPETAPPSEISVIETKPVPEIVALKSEIRPTKPVAKPTKQLSSVVRVVSANSIVSPSSSSPLPLDVNNAPNPVIPKVQIVSSHVKVFDESEKSAPKSVFHVEAIDGTVILPSRVEVIGGVSPSESYVIKILLSICSIQLKILYSIDSFSILHKRVGMLKSLRFKLIKIQF